MATGGLKAAKRPAAAAKPKTGGLAAGVKAGTQQGGYRAPAAAPTTTARPDMYGGGGGGGGLQSGPSTSSRSMSSGGGFPSAGGVGGAAGGVAAASGNPEDWLRADGEYTAAEAAYKNVFDQLAATLDRENTNYDLDYNTAQKNLGWIDEDGEAGPGKAAWAMNNVDTAAGRSYRSLFDDFAGRGMLQGSAFGEAENSLRTSLDKQRDMVDEQRGQFQNSQKERRTQGEQTRDNSIKMAAAQALARVASGLGV